MTHSLRSSRSSHSRMAGARLLHAVTFARLLPGFHMTDSMLRAVDATIEHIVSRHPNTPTGRAWLEVSE